MDINQTNLHAIYKAKEKPTSPSTFFTLTTLQNIIDGRCEKTILETQTSTDQQLHLTELTRYLGTTHSPSYFQNLFHFSLSEQRTKLFTKSVTLDTCKIQKNDFKAP